jgi:beta-glucosidase
MRFWVHALTRNAHRLVDMGADCYQKIPSWLVLVLRHSSGHRSTGRASCIRYFVPTIKSIKGTLYNAIVTDRAMRDIYLTPFQIAQHDSNPATHMTVYNKVGGVRVSENPKILKDVRCGEWRWDGLIMSDWFGTYSANRRRGINT